MFTDIWWNLHLITSQCLEQVPHKQNRIRGISPVNKHTLVRPGASYFLQLNYNVLYVYGNVSYIGVKQLNICLQWVQIDNKTTKCILILQVSLFHDFCKIHQWNTHKCVFNSIHCLVQYLIGHVFTIYLQLWNFVINFVVGPSSADHWSWKA